MRTWWRGPCVGVALCLCLLTTGPARAEIAFAQKNWVANRAGGFCGWCSLEMVGNHHNLAYLKKLVERRQQHGEPGSTTFPELLAFLREGQLAFTSQEPGRGQPGFLVDTPTMGYLFHTRERAQAKLDKLGGQGQIVDHPIADPDILVQAVAADLPVVVVLGGADAGHAVVLTGLSISDNTVQLRDPNSEQEITKTLGWFLNNWDGAAIVIKPDSKEKPAGPVPVPQTSGQPVPTRPKLVPVPTPTPQPGKKPAGPVPVPTPSAPSDKKPTGPVPTRVFIPTPAAPKD